MPAKAGLDSLELEWLGLAWLDASPGPFGEGCEARVG
jgi:hypothetical protein